MRIVTELVGGIILLLIFAHGVRETIKFFKEKKDDVSASDGNAGGPGKPN